MDQVFSKSLDNDFKDLLGSAEQYNLEFDMWKRMAGMVMADMSFECGWKGKHRDMNFSDFSGYYMEYNDEKVSLLCNGVCEGEVIKTDDGIRIEGFEDVTVDQGDSLMVTCGELCRSEENMSLAMNEMHQGNEVIIGLRYKDSIVFGVNNDDMEMRAEIFNRYENVRFVPEDDIYKALNSFREKHLNLGPEPIMPKIERCFYDGQSIRSENEFDPLDLRNKEQIQVDEAILAHLKQEIKTMRKEMEDMIGIAPEHQPFVYNNVLYATDYFRNDTICLCHDLGKSCHGAILVRNGQVGFYKDFYENRSLGEPDIKFKDVSSAVSSMRKFISEPQVIKIAQKEYNEFLLSQKQSKGIKI